MRTRTRIAAIVGAVSLVATACGGGSLNVEQDPKAAVLAAFQGAEDWSGAAMTIRLVSDVPSMLALDEGAGDVTPELARTILASYISIRGTAGDDPQDTADDQFEMLVRIGDLDAIQMRSIEGRLFVRADVAGLLEAFDTSGEAAAGLAQMVPQATSMGLTFVQPAVDGAWLELVGMDQVGQMLGGLTGQPQVDPSEAERAGQAILDQVQTFVEQDVEVSYLGSDDAGEHTRLTASAEDGLDLIEEIVSAGGSLMQQAYQGVDLSEAIADMRRDAGPGAANLTLPLDVWIKGDTVSRIGFDLVAFAQLNPQLADAEEMPEGVSSFSLVVDLEDFGGDVSAPSDPVEVNLFEIFGMLMGGLGGGLGAAA